MEKENYRKLEVGDIVYLFKLEISFHCRINLGIAVELKKTDEDMFMITRVISGRILKVGEMITIDDKYRGKYRSSNLFEKFEDGVEWWNRQIRNAEDGLLSSYETKKKGLTKRLIQI